MFKKINFYQLTITIIAVLFASALVVYGWTAPVGSPPGNDVEPPINTGLTGQIKQGGLSVGSALGATSTGLAVINGNSVFGTTTVRTKGGSTYGFLNTQDVWLRDANGGIGGWASGLGGSGNIESGMDFVSVASTGKQVCPRPGVSMRSAVAVAQQTPPSGTCANCNALMKDFNNPTGCFTVLLNRADTDAGDYRSGNFYWIAAYSGGGGGGGGGGVSCSWVGERAVPGNTGGCIDDLYVTCNGSNVVSMRWGC